MRFYKLILLVVPVLLLSACGGGHNDAHDYYYEETYIDWSGSVNGTIVVDATDDAFEFEINTGYLHFGNTTYTNAWVDHYGDFYVDGVRIGGVYYVLSSDHYTITALISNSGHYIDIYGPESDLAWTEAPTTPIYAIKGIGTSERQFAESIYAQNAKQLETKNTIASTPPEKGRNAYKESLPKNTQSILGK